MQETLSNIGKQKLWFDGIPVLRGSDTSGNYGHTGTPGRGGSPPGYGHSAIGVRPGEDPRERVQARRGSRELEGQLKKGSYTTIGEPGEGVQDSQIVQVEGDGKAIVKTNASGKHGGFFRYDTTRTEEAAYETAKALGYDVVPPTVRTAREGETVSTQAWVDDCMMAMDLDVDTVQYMDHVSARQMMILDTVIGNADRHSGNWIVRGTDGKVFAIDHGACFRPGVSINQAHEAYFQYNKAGLGFGTRAGRAYMPRLTAADMAPVRSLLNNKAYGQYITKSFSRQSWRGVQKRAQELLDWIDTNGSYTIGDL